MIKITDQSWRSLMLPLGLLPQAKINFQRLKPCQKRELEIKFLYFFLPSLLTNFWTCNFWNTVIGLIVDWDSIYLWSSNDREKLIKIKSYFFLGFVVRSWFSLLPLVFISFSTEVKISWLKRRSNRLQVVKKRRKNNTSQGKWISQEVSFYLFIFLTPIQMLIFCYQEDFNGDWVPCGDTLNRREHWKEEQPDTFPCQRSRCEYAGNLANKTNTRTDTIAAVRQLWSTHHLYIMSCCLHWAPPLRGRLPPISPISI